VQYLSRIVTISLEGAPTPWQRPAQMRGSTARFDAQAETKNTHSIIALKQILEWHGETCSKRDSRSPMYPAGTPVAIQYNFFFESPARPSTDFPSKCDLDNLIKYYNDMLQSFYMKGVLWEDDRQITKILAQKQWTPHKSRTEITIIADYEGK